MEKNLDTYPLNGKKILKHQKAALVKNEKKHTFILYIGDLMLYLDVNRCSVCCRLDGKLFGVANLVLIF